MLNENISAAIDLDVSNPTETNIHTHFTLDKDPTRIDLLTISEFTEDHLDVVKNLFGKTTKKEPFGGWPRVYPELFGPDIHPVIKFVGWGIKSPLQLKHQNSQRYKATGRTIKENKIQKIKQNIERNGYKLKYPAIAWFTHYNKNKELITGYSRTDIVTHTPFNISNLIVALYEPTLKPDGSKWSEDEIEDALDTLGSRFNSFHDPATTITPQDVKRLVMFALDRFVKTEGKAGIPCTIDAITERVDLCCGEGVFQPKTKLQLVYEIYNNFNVVNTPNQIKKGNGKHDIISWSGKTGKQDLEDQKKKWKFYDTPTVKYIITDSEMISYSFVKAVKMSADNPDAEIRILLHTGTLSGNHLHLTFINRISKFIDNFNTICRNSWLSFFSESNPQKNNIKIYAVYYALGQYHDLTSPIYINERTSTLYQKSGYSVDYENPSGNGQRWTDKIDLEGWIFPAIPDGKGGIVPIP